MLMKYKCVYCSTELSSYNELVEHKLNKHNISNKVNCKVCGIEITKLGLPSHILNKHKLTAENYYNTYLAKPGEGKCKICGKETSFIGIYKHGGGYLRYCSNICSNNDIEVIEKKNSTCLKNNGYEHPYQSPIIRSKIQKNLKYDNINFDSGWEIQYYIWLKDNNINFIYQPNPIEYFIENKKHYYHPDFYLIDTNEYIEIKASRFLYQGVNNNWNTYSKEKIECIKNHAKILTEETQELKDIFKYIKNKYKLNEGRKSFIKELKKGNIT